VTPSDPPPGDQILDRQIVASLHRLNGVPGALTDLIELFVSSGRARLSELDEALRSGDESVAVAAAHRLRGSSANLGAVQVSAACRLIEERVRAGADPAAAVAAARSAYDEACVALRAEFLSGP
jgi:HPt (histidine-containing phosphotransfer) domain-containing protein